MNRILLLLFFCWICTAVSQPAPAAASDDLASEVETLKTKLAELEAKMAEQKSAPVAQSSDRSLLGKWNPSIGVVADIVARLDSPKEDAEGSDRISAREVEIVFGSDIDAYSRLDVTVSFSDFEDAGLEEAYVTRFGLPFDTTARLGKFKPKVGKAIPVHRDSLETVDEPLVIQRYFGAEGYNKAGLDVTTLLKTGLPVTQEVSIGLLEGGKGEEGTLFGDTRRRPTLYSHLKNYVDISEETNAEWGFSYLTGSRDADSEFEVQVLGSDLTLKHQLNANQALKLQGEVFNVNREETEDDLDGNIWGWYGLADLRVAPQWSVGFRYDNVQPVDNPLENLQEEDTGYTGYVTFAQSEFARWRVQASQFDLSDGNKDTQIMLQGTFAIGEHKHKIQ
jgi:hypothetical protein